MKYPVAEPKLIGNVREYVMECIDTGWISGSGKFLNAFEEQFAAYCGTKHAIAVVNGTVALHLALLALDIGPGDEVIMPDLTYIASPNSVRYCGATPVFVDITPDNWTLDLADVERKITPATKAIMPVHVYGHPAEMTALMALAKRHNLYVVEDAAEAHGAEVEGKRVGGIGDVATFSFFGNKIITTGEGGMITTNNDDMAAKMRILRGQGMDPKRRYWFPVIGYNYRMTNLTAAIGVSQLEHIDWFVERRIQVADWYRAELQDTELIMPVQALWAKSVYWLFCVVVPEGIDRDQVMRDMGEMGVETRPFFYPMHVLPPYHDPDGDTKFPLSTNLSARGINLPSSATLEHEHIVEISDILKQCLQNQKASLAAAETSQPSMV